MNDLIARHIMGWEDFRVDYFGSEKESDRQKELEEWMELVRLENIGDYWIDVDNNFWVEKKRWLPHLLIVDAWKVVEKFDTFYISRYIDNSELGKIYYIAKCAYRGMFYLSSRHNDAPIAICEAALLSRGL